MLFKIKFTYFKMCEQIDGNNVIAFKMNMLNIGFKISTWNCLNLAFCIWQQC